MGHDVLDYGNVPVLELQEEECIQVAATTGSSMRIPQTRTMSTGHVEVNAKNVKQVADANKVVG